MDECTAVEASQAGDRIAFGFLIDRYYRSVYRLAYQYTGDHHCADDVCQETFLRAFDGMKNLRDAKRFRGWVFMIATNLLRKRAKDSESRKRFATKINANSLATSTEGDDGQPFKLVSGKERAMIIQRHLLEMPEHMRLVTILILMEGLSQKDAAGILNCSESSVSRHLEAARNWLRAKLQHLI